MSSQNNKIFAQQLQAWVWEVGVVYDFEEICSRAESLFSHCKDTLESYFNKRKSTTLLFAARKVQKILKGLEGDNVKDSVEDLLKLTVSLLKDDMFYLDRQFITNVIVLHLSAVLFANVNLDFAHDDLLLLNPCDEDSQWERAKKKLNYKGDLYKEVLVTTSKTTHYMKSQIVSGEIVYSSSESSSSLKEKLLKNFQQWVKQVPIPALCRVCGNKELEKLPNPQYKLIFKYILNKKIDTSSLHHILNELEANPNLYSSTESPPLIDIDSDSNISFENSEVLLNESYESAIKMKSIEKNKNDCMCKDINLQKRMCNKNFKKFSNCRNRKKSNYDIIMLKGTIWEINKDASSDEEFFNDDDDIEVQNVIDIRKQTVEWDTSKTNERTSGFDKVYEIRTVSEDDEFGGNPSFCVLDQMKKDIFNLDKLIVKTKLLVTELERKSLLLKEKSKQIKKNNNENDKFNYSFGVQKKKGFQELSPAKTSAAKESKIMSTLVDGDIENISTYCKTSTLTSSTITTTTPTNNNNKGSICESSSSCSMPNLTPYKDLESHNNIDVTKSFEKPSKHKKYLHPNSSSNYTSDRSMPNLTPYNNSASCDISRTEGLNSDFSRKGSPYVPLTPLRQSDLDRLNSALETPNTLRKDTLNKNKEVNSLTKIDLVVTNSHSSLESNAVILELNDSFFPSLIKRKHEKSNSEDSPQAKKRLRITSSTSSEETLKLSENIERKVIDNLNKTSLDNEESFESAKSKLLSSDSGSSIVSSESLVEVPNKNVSTFSLNNSLKKRRIMRIHSKTLDFEDISFTEKSLTKRKLKSNISKTKTNLPSNSRNKSSKSQMELSSSSDELEVEKANYTETLRSQSSVDSKSQKVSTHILDARSMSKKKERYFISDCSDSSTSPKNGKIKKSQGRPCKPKNCINSSPKSRKKNLSPDFSDTERKTSNKTLVMNGTSRLKLKHLNSIVVSTSESSESEENKLNDSKCISKELKKSTLKVDHSKTSFKTMLVVSSSSESEDVPLYTRQCQKRTSKTDESNEFLKTVRHIFPGILKNCYVNLLYNKSLSNRRNKKIYS